MRKKQSPQNGLELLHRVFSSFCQTGVAETIRDDGDLVAHLNTGLHEGRSARLCFLTNQRVWLEFHTHKGSALDNEHEANCVFHLDVFYRQAGEVDKRGSLLEQQFNHMTIDLSTLSSSRLRLMPFLIEFLTLIEDLPGDYVWTLELNASWRQLPKENIPTTMVVS